MKGLKDKAYRKSILKTAIPTGILLAFTMTFGPALEKEGKVNFQNVSVYLTWLLAAAVVTAVLVFAWIGLDACSARRTGKEHVLFQKRWHWAAVFAFLAACYTVTFLASFPGFFTYDAKMAWWEVYSGHYTSQHPLIYVFLLGKMCDYSETVLGNANIGIAVYIYVQMLLITGCFTYALCQVWRRLRIFWVTVAAVLFYALSPTIHMFALCSTKDTAFTGAMLMLLVLLWEMCSEPESFFRARRKLLLFILCSFAFLILRKNAVYAFLVFLPFLFVIMRKYRKRLLLLLLPVAALYWLYSVPFTACFHPEDIGAREALSVPSQQMARVYGNRRDLMTEDEVSLLESFYSRDALEKYLPKLADPVKNFLNQDFFEEHKEKYISLWLSLAGKAPGEYVNSLLVNTYGNWYPFASLDGYRGYAGMEGTVLENAENYYFGYVTEEPGHRTSLLPGLDDYYFWLSTVNLHRALPVLSLLLSPGFFFWVYVVTAAYCIYKRRGEYGASLLLMGIVWLTIQLGPVSLVRYVLFLFFAVPLMLGALFQKEEKPWREKTEG